MPRPLRVVNVGLDTFVADVAAAGVPVVHVDWRPPAGGDPRVAAMLASLDDGGANAEFVARVNAGGATLVDVRVARDVVPGLRERSVLHAGPPVTWDRMCGPMRGTIIGACLYEGWAKTPDEAIALAERGELEFDPTHHHRAIGPMSGIVTPSMAVQVVRNEPFGLDTYATLYEGIGKVMRHGAYDAAVMARVRWLNRELAPLLGAAVRHAGGIDLKNVIAQAVQMGDELHNRNRASNALLLVALAPHLVAVGERDDVGRALAFIDGAGQFTLNGTMAACKGMLDAASGIPRCTLVTTIARNGTETGIRVSGTGERWFTAPAPRIEGVYFPGFGPDDANPDLGDSAITETAGLGSLAMAGAPAIVQYVGGTPQLAIDTTLRMYEITAGEHAAFRIPPLDFRGTPLGIDVRKVVETGIAPVINTGIAHREPGIGQIGAGVTAVPLACFVAAVEALAQA
jgi:hypothetical protein